MGENIKWAGYEWLPQERWGNVHPEKPEAWNDPSAIKIDDDQTLRLYARPNPKEIEVVTDWSTTPPTKKIVKSTVGFGLISCTTHFSYGLFELDAKMPKGPFVWPAFWMWAFETYPPEIDIFESYTNKRGSYFNWTHEILWGAWWRVKSNIHLKDKVKKASVGGLNEDGTNRWQLNAKAHWLGWKNPSKRFNKYGLLWTPDEISIMFNGRKVRTLTDRAVLDQFENVTMNVIINNSIQDGYLKTDMPTTELVAKNFKYTPLSELNHNLMN